MRGTMLLLVWVAGCAISVDEPELPSSVEIDRRVQLAGTMAGDDAGGGALGDDGADVDVCTLAAQLPAEDLCSKACDPDALAAQVLAEGATPGFCYQFFCALPQDQHVLVGVCL